MAFNSKIQLSNAKTYQGGGDTLSLSGITNVAHLKYLGNDAGSYINRSVPDVAYVTGITNTKADKSSIATYTGTTAPNTYALKTSVATYTGTTAPNQFVGKTAFNTYSGTTVPSTYAKLTSIATYTGTTAPNTYATKASVSTFTGTTLPANYYNKTQINDYTGSTSSSIALKADKSSVATYTGTTAPATYALKTSMATYTGTTAPNQFVGKTAFNTYSGNTLNNINSRALQSSVATFTGTTLPANYFNKTQISTYTGATNSRLNGIDADVDYISGATQLKINQPLGQLIFGTGVAGTVNSEADLYYCVANNSIIFGETNSTSGVDSGILGGNNNCTNQNNTVILGGANIKATGATYANAAVVGALAIKCTNFSAGNIICVNPSTGMIGSTSLSSFGGITGGTNGIGTTGQNVCLGGALKQNTTINGCSLTLGALAGIVLRTSGTTDIILNSQSCGGVIIKAQSATTTGNNFTCSVGFYVDYDAPAGFKVYDNRNGAAQTGLIYNADYSLNYVDRSIPDKAYVDSVATGLNVHAAVWAATTTANGNLSLSGTSGSIDGILITTIISTNNRILVKNQTDAKQNGIYSASTGTWGRTADYDNSPTGEISNGDLIPVTSGLTNNNSLFAMVSPNPITIGVSNINFSLFSTTIDVVEGPGIDISMVGGVHTICVQLGTDSGLNTSNGLVVDSSIGGNGLTLTAGVLDVNAANCGSVSAVPVGYNAGDCLVVAYSDIRGSVNAISGATNGLTNTNKCVCLGGALTQNTTVGGASTYSMTMDCLSAFNLGFVGVSTITNGANNGGIRYGGDYSTYYVNRSLVDAAYVTGITSQSIRTATNGLTKIGQNVKLGGALTGATCIDTDLGSLTLNGTVGQSYQFANSGVELNKCGSRLYLTNNGADFRLDSCFGKCVAIGNNGMIYGADYSASFVPRSLVDAAYVTGKTATSGVQTASNGLRKTGTNVVLGGALIENTGISGAYTLNFSGGSKINSMCGYQICGETVLNVGANNKTNICIGHKVMTGLTSGINNVAIGENVLAKVTSGSNNIAIGCDALVANTTGINNFAIGYRALLSNTLAGDNIAIGYESLRRSTGGNNIAMGCLSLWCNTTGYNNIALGYCTSSCNSTGHNNIALGYQSFICNTSGNNNIAQGNGAIYYNQTGQHNIAFGCSALGGQTAACSHSFNIGIGGNSVFAITCGTGNIGLGYQSLRNNTKGNCNIGIGYQAGFSNVVGSGNTFIGGCAGYNETASNKLYIANSGTVNPLIKGDFSTSAITLNAILTLGVLPTVGSTSDLVLVRNSGGEVRTVTTSSVTGGAITGATNGLTKAGQNVNLGGTLCCNTTINGGSQNLTLGNSGSPISDLNVYTSNGTNLQSNGGVNGINLSASSLLVTDGSNSRGLVYAGSYNANFICRSLVTANYVTGITTTLLPKSTFVAYTGVTDTLIATKLDKTFGTNTQVLYRGTTCIESSASFLYNGSQVVVPNLCVTGAVVAGSTSDAILVWNSTDKIVKQVAQSSVGDKNNRVSMCGIGVNTTLDSNTPYVVLVTGGTTITITLPASPADGMAVKIKDARGSALTNLITIADNGNTIDGASTAVINTDFGALEIVYSLGMDKWYTTAFIN